MSKLLPVIKSVLDSEKISHPTTITGEIRHQDIEGTKIVFINMPLRESAQPTTTPEGPLLLATNLIRNYGVDVSIIDLNVYRPGGRYMDNKEVFQLIKDHLKFYGEPHVIAFSGMITTLRWQEIIAKMVRKIMPEVFLVSGNGLATELKLGLFNYIPELDAVAHSEGDDVILKIMYDAKIIKEYGIQNAITSGKLAPYYLGEIMEKHRFMYAGSRPRNLDRLPFVDLELIKHDVYGRPILQKYLDTPVWGIGANNSSSTPFSMKQSTTSVSSRGCPYGCKYCYRGAQGEREWGVRSAEHVTQEIIRNMERYNIDFHGFPDDNFAVTVPRIKNLIPLLKPLGIRWGTHTRLDEGAGLIPKPGSGGKEYIFENPLRVKLMAESGCVYIGFGPESANAKVLEALGKGGFTLRAGFVPISVNGQTYQFPKAMVYGIKHALEAGIHSNCTWIMGSPTETLTDLKETVAFIKWQEEFYSQYNIPSTAVNKKMFTLTWYPGTEMIRHPKVHYELSRVFGIKFDPLTYQPICDENFHNYCLELDDATKILHDPKTGEPLNFGEMPTDQFLQVREYIDTDQIFKILDM